MTTYRFQHSIQDIDALSPDRYVNTWYGAWIGDATQGQLTAMCAAVRAFYGTDSNASAGLVSYYYAQHLNGVGSTVKAYKIDTEVRHEPLATLTFVLMPRTTPPVSMPTEVAACLSFRSSLSPAVSPARRRGRVYLGPLNVDAVASVAGQPVRVAVAFRTVVITETKKLAAAFTLNGGSWVVHSPTTVKEGGAVPDHAVTDIYVDDAFDIQRRRGVNASARTTATIP